MYTPEDRERIRADLLEVAKADPRLSGGAITGSGASGREDRWSDVDLAFGVADPALLADVLADFTRRMIDRHGAVHHFDVRAGAWIYRVFLLASTLQVDLAFAPAAQFGARAPTFRLVFGKAVALPQVAPPSAESLIGWSWLCALHVRSSLARGRLWQAKHMLHAMRDQVLALACVRLGLPAREGRGMDQLPLEVTRPLEAGLVGSLEAEEIGRAFQAVTAELLDEARRTDQGLVGRIEAALLELSAEPD